MVKMFTIMHNVLSFRHIHTLFTQNGASDADIFLHTLFKLKRFWAEDLCMILSTTIVFQATNSKQNRSASLRYVHLPSPIQALSIII